jgi:hypothetical protein
VLRKKSEILFDEREDLSVIPGSGEGANPESGYKPQITFWIPGPALRAAPE